MKKEQDDILLPADFLERMRRLMGNEYEAFVQSYEAERVQGLRFNTLKGNMEHLQKLCGERFGLTSVPWCQEGFYYQADTRPGRHAWHEAGLYYIQEPSAMSVVELLNPKPGERVLDLCAAPGGKTTHIAERLKGKGLLVSNEIMPNRAKILSQNVERMGIANAVVTNEDSGRLRSYFPEYFDCIVVDAPCSGEGMFRKDEQARDEWSEENVRICADRQQEILDNAAAMLRPGGRLVYSTCTFAPEEDEGGIARFLTAHPEFSVVNIPDDRLQADHADGKTDGSCGNSADEQDTVIRKQEKEQKLLGLSRGNQEWAKECGDYPEELRKQLSDTLRIWPHKAEGEGHFLALLKKNGSLNSEMDVSLSESEKSVKKSGKKMKGNDDGFYKEKEGLEALKGCLKEILCKEAQEQKSFPVDMEHLVLYGEQLYMLPVGLPTLAGLKVLRPGLHLGTIRKNRMEPAHALALALKKEQVSRSVSFAFDDPKVLDYLHGNTVAVDPGMKGWVLMMVDGYSLGWGKAASGIMKNHYPKGLRIQG